MGWNTPANPMLRAESDIFVHGDALIVCVELGLHTLPYFFF